MQEQTPKQLALRIAIIVALGITILCSVFLFIAGSLQWWHPIVILAGTFILSFVLLQQSIERFIYQKIKAIYKTIHKLKVSDDNKEEKLDMNRDIFKEVSKEVLEWEKSNRQEIERLKGLEAYRREFIGNISHELKTPIFNIQGYILTLLEGGLEDPGINRNYLERAEKSIDRMTAIVDDLDMITKLESGGLELELDKVDIIELSKDVISSLELTAKEKDISLQLKNDYDKPIWVEADKDRIAQVLTNLMVNSIKYGKKGGGSKIGFTDMDQNILIEVEDNGLGVAEEHIPRLFERFYRIDKSRSRAQGGTGLGLAIVKHIIEAHQQTINVTSKPGEGSTFAFTLKKKGD